MTRTQEISKKREAEAAEPPETITSTFRTGTQKRRRRPGGGGGGGYERRSKEERECE